MKTRIITGLVGTVVLFALLLCPYTQVWTVALALAAAMAVYELLHNTGWVKDPFLLYGSMLFAIIEVLICGLAPQMVPGLPMIVLLLYSVYMALMMLRRHATVKVTDGAFGFMLATYAAAGFSSLVALRLLGECGLAHVLLALVIPWMSDTGAYFVGTFLGKHKMSPVISPKKSWEGFFGGWAISVGCSILLGIIFKAATGIAVSEWWKLALIAFVLAPISVCGDLFASVIKRQSGIKDYGKIMPGHGGIMDRFDSVVMIAPLLYICLVMFR